tara:strand:+ start:4115 stop:7810 length:3696 start_codon:yes stop_codon:yes gene_type:complete
MSDEYLTEEEFQKHIGKSNSVSTVQSTQPVVQKKQTDTSEYLSDSEFKSHLQKPPPPKKVVEQPSPDDAQFKEVYSIKELEEDDQFLKDYLKIRKDFEGIDETEGTGIPLFGRGPFSLFEQELTAENIVDDALDGYRFVTTNSVSAYQFYDKISSLNKESKRLKETGNEDDYAKSLEYDDQVATAKRVFMKLDRVAGVTDWSKRYEGKTAFEQAAEFTSMIPTYIASIASDPLSLVSLGVGKLVTIGAQKTATTALIKSVLATAGTEGAIAAGTDLLIQGAEIEMGIKNEIDEKRVYTVAGVSALTAGTLQYVGTRNTLKKTPKADKDKFNAALKKIEDSQVASAKITNKKLNAISSSMRQDFGAQIEATYGKNAVVKDKDGKFVRINSEVIREKATDTMKKFLDDELDLDVFAVNTTNKAFERTIAGVSEASDKLAKGEIKLTDPAMAKVLSGPLNKKEGETISERMLNILTNVTDESLDEATAVFAKYGVTQKEIASVMFAEASISGQKLNRLSQLAKRVGGVNFRKTAQEKAEEAANTQVGNLRSTFRKLEDIRRLTLVSGVATAVRNSISGVQRSGIDTLVYGLEAGIHQAVTGRKKLFVTDAFADQKRKDLVKKYVTDGMGKKEATDLANKLVTKQTGFQGGFKNTLAQVENTYIGSGDSTVMAKFLLDMNPTEKNRFYNQYSEITRKLNNKNPNQSTLAGKGQGIEKNDGMLDTWEKAIHGFNFFNRQQEFLFRHGAFTTSLQRQLYDKGLDMMGVLESGRVTENISESMVKKAVDDALEFTYAAQPEWGLFKTANNFIVKSGLTLVIPFPRFMFKAIEMTHNYNITGAMHGMISVGRKGLKEATDRDYRRIAEGVAGGLPMLSLGYMLADPENDLVGSEWYMLKTIGDTEVDARPYFPLTPYLYIGTMIHRKLRGDPIIPIGSRGVDEMLEGFTGTNFRGSGAMSALTKDMVNIFSGEDEAGAKSFSFTMGKYLGEAVTGYGQPIYQFGDLFRPESSRKKDYKENPDYENGLAAFFQGVYQPLKSRIDRVPLIGEFVDEEKLPDLEDPRYEATPERVMPFLKLLFGATLNRVPPDYVVELSQMGFNYRDFMARTNVPSFDRALNREMGYRMNKYMPEYLKDLNEEIKADGKPFSREEKIAFIDDFIKDQKKQIRATIKGSTDEEIAGSLLRKFMTIPARKRRNAKKIFIESEFPEINKPKGEPFDYSNKEHIDILINIATAYKN